MIGTEPASRHVESRASNYSQPCPATTIELYTSESET